MTIEIISTKKKAIENLTVWVCNLDISQLGQTYSLPVVAPGSLAKGELQNHFDAIEARLWTIAETKAVMPDIFDLSLERVLKALALVVIDEINILRTSHGLSVRDESQIVGAIKNKLQSFQP